MNRKGVTSWPADWPADSTSERDGELLRLAEDAMSCIGKVREKADILMDMVHPGTPSSCHDPAESCVDESCDRFLLVMWQFHHLAEADRILASMQLLVSGAKVH